MVVSQPALTLDAILNMIKIKLELISYASTYLFLQRGMRDWVS